MAHTHTDETDNETVQHEESDINIGAISKFVIYLVLVTVVVHVFVWFLMGSLNRELDEASVVNFPLAAEQGERLPPQPRLQILPREELTALRADWKTRLEGFSWVDKQAGTVRIPIEQAMRRVLDTGIPTRSAAATAPTPAPQGSETTR